MIRECPEKLVQKQNEEKGKKNKSRLGPHPH